MKLFLWKKLTLDEIASHSFKHNFLTALHSMLLQGPQGSVDKPFLWTEGRVNLKASLNKSAYTHGENVNVTIDVRNDSRKVVRKIRVSFNLPKWIKSATTSQASLSPN